MGNFFNIEGRFYKISSIIGDMFILGIAWFLFSIPIITIGASTKALYYATTKRISGEEAYVLREFKKDFLDEIFKATLIWIVIIIVAFMLVIDLQIMKQASIGGGLLIYIIYFLFFELIIVSINIFPLMSKFKMSFGNLVKTAIFLGNRHLPTSIICFLMGTTIFYMGLLMPPVFVVGMGIYSFTSAYFLMKVFKKYNDSL